ncbi:MAG: hypothetical protein V1917_00825 [Candidatus Gottesmanbacteria bacterium]
MKILIYKLWRKLLPILYIFVLIHFLKDITQDILKIPTFLDLLGDVREDISSFPLVIQNIFTLLGYGSFVAEIFLLVSIPITLKKKEMSVLEKVVVAVVLFLLFFFMAAILLDPRSKI